MTRRSIFIAMAGLLLACGSAVAQDAPISPKPGPEIEALKMLARDWTFKSHIVKGMLYKDSPEVPAHGLWKCDWLLDGLWASCYMADEMEPVKNGKGPLANGGVLPPWKAWVYVGWDVEDKTYRMIGVDSWAASHDWVGKKEGNKFIFVSKDFRTSQGLQQKFRFTWDFTDPKAVKFVQENQIKGETVWRPLEVAIYTPANLPR